MSRTLFLLIFLFSLSLPQADGERKHLKIYRVADLVGEIKETSQEKEVNLRNARRKIQQKREVAGNYYVCSPEDLMDLLNEMIPLETENVLKIVENRLVAYLSTANHEKVKMVLDQLRQEPLIFVNFQVALVEYSKENWANAWKSYKNVLSSKEKEALFALGEVKRVVQFGGLNNQICEIFSGSQTSYVGDYSVEIASQSSIADPQIMKQEEGIALEIKPVVGEATGELILEGEYEINHVKAWADVDLTKTNLGLLRNPEVETQGGLLSKKLKSGEILCLVQVMENTRYLLFIEPTIQVSSTAKSSESK